MEQSHDEFSKSFNSASRSKTQNQSMMSAAHADQSMSGISASGKKKQAQDDMDELNLKDKLGKIQGAKNLVLKFSENQLLNYKVREMFSKVEQPYQEYKQFKFTIRNYVLRRLVDKPF